MNEPALTTDTELEAMRDTLRHRLQSIGVDPSRVAAIVEDGELTVSGIAPEQWSRRDQLEIFALLELALEGEPLARERLQPHIESYRRNPSPPDARNAWFNRTPASQEKERNTNLLIVLFCGILLGFLIGYTLGARFGMLGFGVT